MKPLITILVALMILPMLVSAQPAPPSPNGPPNGQAGPPNGPPDDGQQATQDRLRQRRMDEIQNSDGPMRQYERMKQYLDLVDRYATVSRDPTTAGIAAVVAATDTLRPRGADAAIDYFNKLLPETKDPAVVRAIRAQLADLYKQSGQQDKALDQLKTLITGATGDSAAAH